MPAFFPTGREVVLLTLLLVILLSVSNTFKSAPISIAEITKLRSAYYAEEPEEVQPLSFESQYSLQSLTAPLNWGLGQVPQTQLLAHVPGEFYVSKPRNDLTRQFRVDHFR